MSTSESKIITIANTAAAYSSGDLIGQPMMVEFSNVPGGTKGALLQSLAIASEQNKKLKIYILSTLPTTVIADNAAYQPNVADGKAMVGVIAVDAFDATFTAINVAIAKQLALPVLKNNTDRKFWIVVAAAEAQTFTAANAISITANYYIN